MSPLLSLPLRPAPLSPASIPLHLQLLLQHAAKLSSVQHERLLLHLPSASTHHLTSPGPSSLPPAAPAPCTIVRISPVSRIEHISIHDQAERASVQILPLSQCLFNMKAISPCQ